jgi:NAD-dependent deacetylase
MQKEDLDGLINRASDLIVDAGKVVVFTGAGVSTESGIPDFRSPGGIWERFNQDDFTYQKFVSDADNRRWHWQLITEGNLVRESTPNPAHYAIAALDQMGKLDCVITQNIDNLHEKAGVPGSKVFELHGNMQWAVCIKCGRHYTMEQAVKILKDGGGVADCPSCGGIIKPDVVMFGEPLPSDVLEEAAQRSACCDLFMVIGSSLVVFPAAYMPEYALNGGARLIIINLASTRLDGRADLTIRAKAGEVTPLIVENVEEKMPNPGQ